MPRRVVIMGAAGRDFHDFNTAFRDDQNHRVVAFTAEQIPGIENREYPAELAGPLYDDPIPILPASDLETIVADRDVDEVVLSYSDLGHEYVMHQASRALAAGADFRLIGPDQMMLTADVPVVAVCAVRTGSGKSQTTRLVVRTLKNHGLNPVVVRHPMPYGDLAATKVQRFATHEDIDRYDTTVEEREEYEDHVERGTVVYAGVDYAAILQRAQDEADIIVWDGGNNDLPFYRPDLHVVLTDPLRPGHEKKYHPGEANARMADVILINKIDTADGDAIREVRNNIRDLNPDATICEAASPVTLENHEMLRGKRVLVVEDGPTVTHGDMPYGAGHLAAEKYGATPIDPRPHATGTLEKIFDQYPHLGNVLPAMGYGKDQLNDLETTIANAAAAADAVVLGTPSDLTRLIDIDLPVHRAGYELETVGEPKLEHLVAEFLADRDL